MEFYHVYNRGVEKRSVVLDDGDRIRFVRSLYVFNDCNNAPNAITQKNTNRKRNVLVHIHAWCLMDNHYHLLLSPVNDENLNMSKFMKKLNMGYAKFFNEKYNRSGLLWQGKYKKVLIKHDGQFMYVPYYIHLNPLDFTHPEWRTGGLSNTQDALDTLKSYRWSSYCDYIGEKNFPSLITTKYISSTLGDTAEQKQQISSIISNEKIASPSKSIEM